MTRSRPAIFRGRHFEPEIIATCVRWYLRFSLSLRNVEEMMAERGLMVDHTTVWRWCQKYGPMIYQRLRGKLKYTTTTWHMDETYVRIAGRWVYLFRAVDSHGDTVDFYLSETRDREAAKTFLQKALSNPDHRTPHMLCMDKCRIYTPLRFEICKPKGISGTGVDEGPNDTPTIELNRTTEMSSGESVPCRARGRCRRRVE